MNEGNSRGAHRAHEREQLVVAVDELGVVEHGQVAGDLGTPVPRRRRRGRCVTSTMAVTPQPAEVELADVSVGPVDDDGSAGVGQRSGRHVGIEGERVEQPLVRLRVAARCAWTVVTQPEMVELAAVTVVPRDGDVPVVALDAGRPELRAGPRSTDGNRSPPQARLVVSNDLTRGETDRAQRLHDRDEALVAPRFELADRAATSMLVGLLDDAVDQFLGELGNVGQLRPRPFEGRTELGQEVAHPGLATGDAVDEKRTHRAPAQSGAEPDGIVDLAHRGYPIVDEPEGLAPQRFEQTVGDEAVDLGVEHQRGHPDRPVHRSRGVDDVVLTSPRRRTPPRAAAGRRG